MRARGTTSALAPALLVVLALLTGGCAAGVTGPAVAAPEVAVAGTAPGTGPARGTGGAWGTGPAGADRPLLQGTDGGDDDRLVAAILGDLERFWGTELPRETGRAFAAPRAYVSVDPEIPGPPPPCAQGVDEVEGNASYCPREDALVVDRGALVPVLRQGGDAAVAVVVAHEFGHAVAQQRDGTPDGADPPPAILVEARADCDAAAFLRAMHDDAGPRTDDAGIDAAMAALMTFRDPLGVGQDDEDAHGDAFDRVTSFQTGYERGAGACAAMTAADRQFALRPVSTSAERAVGPAVPLDVTVARVGADLDRALGDLVRARGRTWRAPVAVPAPPACPGSGAVQGPVAWCAADATLRLDPGPALADAVQRRTGDFATALLLASRHGLAALAALGRPSTGPDAGRTALCLAGAWAATTGLRGPGDLDEAVTLLMRDDAAARGADGAPGATTGYARVAEFRRGTDGGPAACLSQRSDPGADPGPAPVPGPGTVPGLRTGPGPGPGGRR